jgi:hypothetical protein
MHHPAIGSPSRRGHDRRGAPPRRCHGRNLGALPSVRSLLSVCWRNQLDASLDRIHKEYHHLRVHTLIPPSFLHTAKLVVACVPQKITRLDHDARTLHDDINVRAALHSFSCLIHPTHRSTNATLRACEVLTDGMFRSLVKSELGMLYEVVYYMYAYQHRTVS